jgi:hypothetical protein
MADRAIAFMNNLIAQQEVTDGINQGLLNGLDLDNGASPTSSTVLYALGGKSTFMENDSNTGLGR